METEITEVRTEAGTLWWGFAPVCWLLVRPREESELQSASLVLLARMETKRKEMRKSLRIKVISMGNAEVGKVKKKVGIEAEAPYWSEAGERQAGWPIRSLCFIRPLWYSIVCGIKWCDLVWRGRGVGLRWSFQNVLLCVINFYFIYQIYVAAHNKILGSIIKPTIKTFFKNIKNN